jgi:methyltransferase family protein
MADQTAPVAPREGTGTRPEYGSYYYLHDCGIPYERNEHWLGFFDRIAEQIVREFHPSTVLDAGCAMGFLVEGLRKRGVDAEGIDVSEFAISEVHESVAAHCRVASLNEPLPGRYDLITCIEVLEHIPPEQTGAAITNLCAASDRLLISTSPSDFGEPTHLNVQPPEFWSAAFASHGFFREVDRDLSYITPWATLYVRREEPLPDMVRRYDRAWWRLREEVQEVREALLKSQEQLAQLESGDVEDRPRLQQELDRRQEEILRLRDLLIGRDAELGAARGRLCELEDQNQRVANVANRVHSRIPGVFRLFGSVLRRLRAIARG